MKHMQLHAAVMATKVPNTTTRMQQDRSAGCTLAVQPAKTDEKALATPPDARGRHSSKEPTHPLSHHSPTLLTLQILQVTAVAHPHLLHGSLKQLHLCSLLLLQQQPPPCTASCCCKLRSHDV